MILLAVLCAAVVLGALTSVLRRRFGGPDNSVLADLAALLPAVLLASLMVSYGFWGWVLGLVGFLAGMLLAGFLRGLHTSSPS